MNLWQLLDLEDVPLTTEGVGLKPEMESDFQHAWFCPMPCQLVTTSVGINLVLFLCRSHKSLAACARLVSVEMATNVKVSALSFIV